MKIGLVFHPQPFSSIVEEPCAVLLTILTRGVPWTIQ
jgi:hypothetical protein